jgi:hypothetical protein
MRGYLPRWAPPAIGLLIGAALTMGCATLPGNPTEMSAEQLKELVKDKNANVGCATVQTPYKGNVVYLVLDKAVIVNGSIIVDSDCKITITSEPNFNLK